MATRSALDDVSHWWGEDLDLSPSGDLARSNRADRSRQRVLRRLLTNPGDYVFHSPYGAGVPQRVGTNLNIPEITALIRGQMQREASVLRNPAPVVKPRAILNGVQVNISYVALPDRQPVSLVFSADEND